MQKEIEPTIQLFTFHTFLRVKKNLSFSYCIC